jgi:two-component system OmpR family response regulator
MRILIAEDDPVLAEQIKSISRAEGLIADIVHDGGEAAFRGETEPYDAIVLDLGLPERDGLTVLKDWRAKGIGTPVLILSARDSWSGKVDGLDAGADDYLTKPFHFPELLARLRALIRRKSGHANPIFSKGGVDFDSRSNEVSVNGVPVKLTSFEIAVLSSLFHNNNRMVTWVELAEHIYEYDGDRDSNTIAVFVSRLRRKLGDDLIETVRRRGYVIKLAA